jgi:hypothetical protein
VCAPSANVAAEFLANPHKRAINVTCSLSHAGCGRQRNKRDNQQILDQSLATFVIVKSIHETNDSSHFLLLEISASSEPLCAIWRVVLSTAPISTRCRRSNNSPKGGIILALWCYSAKQIRLLIGLFHFRSIQNPDFPTPAKIILRV